MADTLIDEPPPPTLRDPVAPPAPAPRASIGRRLAIGASVLVALLAVAGVAVYLFFIHYEAVARRHVPGNASLVMRLDAADAVLFGPVRKHLWPLAVERATRSGKTRGQRIRAATGVNLATDLREVIVASTDASSWVLIAGGRIARGKLVAGLEKIAQEEGWALHREGDLLVGTGLVIAQAEDGTILVGTDATIVNAALPASDDARHLDLPEDGVVTFAVTKQAWNGAAGIATVAHASVLRHVERASGRMKLGPAPEMSMSITPIAGVSPADLAHELDDVSAELRLVTLLLPDVAGEKSALSSVIIKPDEARVTVTAPWPFDGLDRAAQRLASLLEGNPR
ncbi:hypothetical protein A7982_12678 [Minicystis rosea]|nr:hypothetical protein A7982_12678 [Minicystis rosea]